MTDLLRSGLAGLGTFRVSPGGEVRFDPSSPGGWAEGLTETGLTVAVRDAAGAVAFTTVGVDVTRAAATQIEQVAGVQGITGGNSIILYAAPALVGDLRIAALGRRRAGETIIDRAGMTTLVETSIDGLFVVASKAVDAADAAGGNRFFSGSGGRSFSGRFLTISAGGAALGVRQSAVATGVAAFPVLSGVLSDSLLIYAWMTGGGGDLASPTLPALSLPAREGVGVAVGVGPDEQRAGHALIEPTGSTSPAASVPFHFSFTALSVLEVARL